MVSPARKKSKPNGRRVKRVYSINIQGAFPSTSLPSFLNIPAPMPAGPKKGSVNPFFWTDSRSIVTCNISYIHHSPKVHILTSPFATAVKGDRKNMWSIPKNPKHIVKICTSQRGYHGLSFQKGLFVWEKGSSVTIAILIAIRF